MATVGQDFGPYRQWFDQHGIRLDAGQGARRSCSPRRRFITTDLDDNQITAFHPGAMMRSHENHVRDVDGVTFGIVAPDGRDAMLQHATSSPAAGIPFIFDPGQAMPLFNGEEFRAFHRAGRLRRRQRLRISLLQERTGWNENDIAVARSRPTSSPAARAARASTTRGKTCTIPPAHERRITDPTGCGDAYRAGLIFGLMRGYGLPTCGRMASLMGALKIEHPGTQNQRFTYAEFAEQFRQQFGYAL